MNKIKDLLPVIIIGLLLAAVAGYFINAAQYRKKFMPGMVLNGVDVSDMSAEEVTEAMRDQTASYSLLFKFLSDAREQIKASDIGLKFECGDEVKELIESQNRYLWLISLFKKPESFTLETPVEYDETKLRQAIEAMPELDPVKVRRPVDARLSFGPDGRLAIVPETNGNSIDADKLEAAAKEAILSREPVLDVVTAEGIYEEPAVRARDAEIQDRMAMLNGILDTTVTYKLSDGSEMSIDRETTREWLSVDEIGGCTLSDEELAEKARGFIREIAAKDDNYGYFRTFDSTNFGRIKLGTESLHGHSLDIEKMGAELEADLKAHKDASHTMTYGQFVDDKDPAFGGTYVEVDVLNQRVYYYIDNELYYDCGCVTGTEGSHSTPSGIFSIIDKENGRYLMGYNSDGSVAYKAYVEYWMSFYPHYGLHDASWRDSFGGERYLYDGSHGCVNLSRYSAGKIYGALDYDTPVIVFRGHDDFAVPEDEIDPNTEDSISD